MISPRGSPSGPCHLDSETCVRDGLPNPCDRGRAFTRKDSPEEESRTNSCDTGRSPCFSEGSHVMLHNEETSNAASRYGENDAIISQLKGIIHVLQKQTDNQSVSPCSEETVLPIGASSNSNLFLSQ